MYTLVEKFIEIKKVLKDNPIVSEEMPINYAYSLDSQLFGANIDTDLGLKMKEQDGTEPINIRYKNCIQERYKDHVAVYTDASKITTRDGKVGAAIWDSRSNSTQKYRLPSHTTVKESEAFAILKGIRHAWFNNYKKVIIVSDAKGVIQESSQNRVSSNYANCIMDIKLKLMLMERQGVELTLVWMPVHMGISEMEKIDEIAKEARNEITLEKYNPSYRSIMDKIEERYYKDLHKNMKILYKKDLRKFYVKNSSCAVRTKDKEVLRKFNRTECTGFPRLLAGYIADNKYLHRIGVKEDNKCTCGEEQNLEHALWVCTQNSVARYKLMESLEIN